MFHFANKYPFDNNVHISGSLIHHFLNYVGPIEYYKAGSSAVKHGSLVMAIPTRIDMALRVHIQWHEDDIETENKNSSASGSCGSECESTGIIHNTVSEPPNERFRKWSLYIEKTIWNPHETIAVHGSIGILQNNWCLPSLILCWFRYSQSFDHYNMLFNNCNHFRDSLLEYMKNDFKTLPYEDLPCESMNDIFRLKKRESHLRIEIL